MRRGPEARARRRAGAGERRPAAGFQRTSSNYLSKYMIALLYFSDTVARAHSRGQLISGIASDGVGSALGVTGEHKIAGVPYGYQLSPKSVLRRSLGSKAPKASKASRIVFTRPAIFPAATWSRNLSIDRIEVE